MPSLQLLGAQSGGTPLVSGDVFSGMPLPVGGVQLLLDSSGAGPVYVGLPVPSWFSGQVSGLYVPTINSGGSLSSGGLTDGVKLGQGNGYFVPKLRMTSGIQSIRIAVPAGSSGAILYWELF